MTARLTQSAVEPTDDELFAQVRRHVERSAVELDRTDLMADLDGDRR